jgi:signal transduction histidine kinase
MIDALKSGTTLERNISERLTHLYILALTAVAIFAVFGQSAVQYALTNQISASGIVNIAGRQRMLSQRVCKNILLLTDDNHKIDKQVYLKDLNEILPIWKTCHNGLKNGVVKMYDTRIVTKNSVKLDSMLTEIDPIFHRIHDHAVFIKNKLQQNNYAVDDSIRASLQIILDNERSFIIKQDKIVHQYDAEAKARVEKLKKMEFSLLAFTIIVLALEGFFVFRPAVRHIRKTIDMLIKEEAKTKQINESLKKAEMELIRAEKEKYQQQVNEQRVRSASVVQGEEEERNRISKELHDGLGQLLTTLKLTFETIDSQSLSSEKEKKAFREGKELIQETIDEVRNISFNLMPSVLSDFGVASALKLLCIQTARNTSKTIIFEDANWISQRLDRNVEIGLYRIAQEALNNAIKYSEVDEINIELGIKNDTIELSILDKGKGFQPTAAAESIQLDKQRNGISNMQERAEMIGGFVKIVTNKGRGTKVYAKIPLKYPKHE